MNAEDIRPGEVVMTSGGFRAKVIKVSDCGHFVECSRDGGRKFGSYNFEVTSVTPTDVTREELLILDIQRTHTRMVRRSVMVAARYCMITTMLGLIAGCSILRWLGW